MPRNFIAIGGGEMGRIKTMPDGSIKKYPVETLNIDSKIVNLTNKKNPEVLVIGTASYNNDGYFKVVEKHFSKRLNCKVLRFYESSNIEQQILNTDIIYISGGDTRYMLKQWKKLGVDKVLLKAYNQEIIIAGYSAGAICWFDYYDNFDYADEDNYKPALLKGLGLLPGCAGVHYNMLSNEEKQNLNKLTIENNIKLYTIENCQALFFENEKLI